MVLNLHYRKLLERPKRVKSIRLQRRPSLHSAPIPEKPRKIRVLFLCYEGIMASHYAAYDFSELIERRGLKNSFEVECGGVYGNAAEVAKKAGSFDFLVPVSKGVEKRLKQVFEEHKKSQRTHIIELSQGKLMGAGLISKRDYAQLYIDLLKKMMKRNKK